MTELTCIVCPKGCHLLVDEQNGFSVSGAGCPRGEAYGKKELTAPSRTLTTTVAITGALHPRLPVKTNGEIPKEMMFQAAEALRLIHAQAPIQRGDVLVKDLLGTGVDVIASKDMERI